MKTLSNEEFVKTCAEVHKANLGYDELMKRTGMQRGSIAARIFKLRQSGVGIPMFRRQYAPLDVAGLNSIIQKVVGPGEKPAKKAPRKRK